MKKNHFIIFLLSLFVSAQVEAQEPIMAPASYYPKVDREVFKRGNYDIGFAKDVYADIDGSPYMPKTFQYADVELIDGTKYANLPVRINFYEQTVHYVSDSTEEFYFKKGAIKKIAFWNSDKTKIEAVYKTGFPGLGNLSKVLAKTENLGENNLYQVLAEGKCSLLKGMNTTIYITKQGLSLQEHREFNTQTNHFLFLDGEMVKVVKSKEKMASVFAKNEQKMSAYIKANKINLKNEEDLIRMVDYYNEQVR